MRDAEREAAYLKMTQRIGEFIVALEEGMGTKGLEGGRLTGVVVRMSTEERPECLVVVKAVVGEERWVAFVGALALDQALLMWRAKEKGRGLKWREDRPWGEAS